jgi:hypothetical protein
MKTGFAVLLLLAVSCLAQENAAPTNELAFGLGGILALARNDSVSLNARSGLAFQVNYGRRFLNRNKVALYDEINFMASPLRDVSTPITTTTRDFASIVCDARNSGEVAPRDANFSIRNRRRWICRLRAEPGADRWPAQPSSAGTGLGCI